MLPTLPFTLNVRSFGSALPRQGLYAPPLTRAATAGSTRSTAPVRCWKLDSSAEELAAADARSRAFVHVAYTSVFCPDELRRELNGSNEHCSRQRPWPTSNCDRANHAPRRATLPRCASSDRRASHATSAGTSWLTFAESAQARELCRWLQPALQIEKRQGGPSNHERRQVHEERNVGECLAARGVPNCHH